MTLVKAVMMVTQPVEMAAHQPVMSRLATNVQEPPVLQFEPTTWSMDQRLVTMGM